MFLFRLKQRSQTEAPTDQWENIKNERIALVEAVGRGHLLCLIQLSKLRKNRTLSQCCQLFQLYDRTQKCTFSCGIF